MAQILIIDDEPQVRLMFQKLLTPHGHTVIVAANGREGIRKYQEESVDLVITDLIMPEKEGIETIRELKKKNPDIKIIAMSGGGKNKPEDYLCSAKLLGASEVFAKPIRKQNILEAINRLL